MQELKNHRLATDLTKQIQRRWKAGDVYAPHDLSSAEMQKWKKRGRPESDVFDLLDMNPVEEYKVCFSITIHSGIQLFKVKSSWPMLTGC